MKFSIVIPVYNVEAYVEECIESILAQTYTDYEIILVDDGSTDKSGEICDRYAQMHADKVVVIHNRNQGQLLTRSCGIDHASGDVLMFLDSDDAVRADALELLHGRFVQTNCDMVLHNASTRKDFAQAYCDFQFEDGRIFTGEQKRELYQLMVMTQSLNTLWIKAVKRHIALSVPEEYRYFGLRNAGDLLYAMPMLDAAEAVCYLKQNLYYYRFNPDSIVHTYNPARHRSIKKVHGEMEKYIDRWGLQELHPMHFAREVRGWVVCLKQLMIQAGKWKNGSKKQLMQELATDGYFRNAYSKMAAETLSKSDILLARLLYEKKYGCLKLLGAVVCTANKIRKLLRRAA